MTHRKLIALLALVLFMAGCPKNLDASKGAVLDIQKSLDLFKDGLTVIQSNHLIPDADSAELATRAKAINTANNALIDAAWAGDVTTQLDALTKALSDFINSGAVVKNKGSQQAINTLVDALVKDLKVLKK
jgi:hypothetical protein